MSYYGSIKVSDHAGWNKIFQLEKAIVMIGSASYNDIVLTDDHGSGVAPIHLQVISSAMPGAGLKVINLKNTPVTRVSAKASQNSLIYPNRAAELEDGDQIILGDYSLSFSLLQTGVSISKRSDHIGLEMDLPSLKLRKDGKLAGLVRLTNFSDQSYSQFELDLEGLPPECYQIAPAPLLYPGGTEQLAIRFFHRITQPQAGKCPFRLRVFSPGTYPTEEVTISAVLDVEPVYQFHVDVLPVHPEEPAIIDRPVQPETPSPVEATQPMAAIPPVAVVLPEIPAEASEKPEGVPAVPAEQPLGETTSIVESTPNQPDQPLPPEEPPSQPEDSGWGDAMSNLNPGRKSRAARDLKNVRVLRATPEPTTPPAESIDGNDSNADAGDQHD
jgi:hypothetical protein